MSGTDATKPDWVTKHNADLSAQLDMETEAKERLEGDLAEQKLHFLNMTADQQIRAKALECAAIYATSGELILDDVRNSLLDIAEEFERYISEGK